MTQEQDAQGRVDLADEIERYLAEGERALRRGRHERARQAFAALLELDPRHALAHNKLGVALAELGRLDEAEAAFRRAIELDPKLPNPYTNLGNIYFSRGQYREAEEHHKRALAIDPDLAHAHQNLAAVYKRTGRIAEAVAAQKAAARLDRVGALDAGESLRRAPAARPGRGGAAPLPARRWLWYLAAAAALGWLLWSRGQGGR